MDLMSLTKVTFRGNLRDIWVQVSMRLESLFSSLARPQWLHLLSPSLGSTRGTTRTQSSSTGHPRHLVIAPSDTQVKDGDLLPEDGVEADSDGL